MCCLFGLIDHGNSLTGKEKTRLIRSLAQAAEERGTDAAGVAFHSKGQMNIIKKGCAAHTIPFHIPADAAVVMGHTRMTTQGSAAKNHNNHPFLGHVGKETFALAHNGVLWNDDILREQLHLPPTKIETDSYIATQILEEENALNHNSLKKMAELVQGSFVFTVLDSMDNLYFVHGDNPLCIFYFPDVGVYAYASTQEILAEGLFNAKMPWAKHPHVILTEPGEILKVSPRELTWGEFRYQTSTLFGDWHRPPRRSAPKQRDPYWEELLSVAANFGYDPDELNSLRRNGFSVEEIEDFLYFGEI